MYNGYMATTTTKNATPGPRPSNPADISFAPECFEHVGDRTEYVVPAPKGSARYPEKFTSRKAAEDFARVSRLPVHEYSIPVLRRIRWN